MAAETQKPALAAPRGPQHTPGPWRVLEPDHTRPSEALVYAHAGAEIYKAPLTVETEANAHLIAAAPELLAALRAADEVLADLADASESKAAADAIRHCRAFGADALAKAEGGAS